MEPRQHDVVVERYDTDSFWARCDACRWTGRAWNYRDNAVREGKNHEAGFEVTDDFVPLVIPHPQEAE